MPRKNKKRLSPNNLAPASPQHKNSPPKSLDQYLAKSDSFKVDWNNAEHVVSKMRKDGVSLQQASREFEINPRKVVRLVGSALRKRSNGKYVARSSDRLLRVLVIPALGGLREIAVNDSHQATLIGKYWAAVEKYISTGDASALRRIRRKQIIDASGKRIALIKDLAELDRIGSAGDLSFETMYSKVG